MYIKETACHNNALTQISHGAITQVLQIVTYACCSGERNGAQRRTKVSFDKTMMQALAVGKKALLRMSFLLVKKGMAISRLGSYTDLACKALFT